MIENPRFTHSSVATRLHKPGHTTPSGPNALDVWRRRSCCLNNCPPGSLHSYKWGNTGHPRRTVVVGSVTDTAERDSELARWLKVCFSICLHICLTVPAHLSDHASMPEIHCLQHMSACVPPHSTKLKPNNFLNTS